MKTQSKFGFLPLLACFVISLSTPDARGFSLLGPFQPWMEYTNGLRQPGDIGGPMGITNGYRWNVPVVTYGFDQSFLDFFGSNGVAAVESAIQILNNLPPASQIVLNNYPSYSQQRNYTAYAQGLFDLKSETLSLLLEQMGLAQPTRYTFVLKQWTPQFTQAGFDSGLNPDYSSIGQDVWGDWAIPDFIDELNFDPITLSASPYLNNTLFTATISGWDSTNHVLHVFPADPFAFEYTAVADQMLEYGGFYNSLTYDDVGGLAYLLSANNIHFETLLPGVVGVGTNANSFVNGAWRPGVDKITFVRIALDPVTGEMYSPLTNYYTDNYLTNGMLMQQQVARVISGPDVLFSAGDVDSNSTMPWITLYSRTGTTNWINNAAFNGNPGGAGPGVIQPPVQIVFNKMGREMSSFGGSNGDADETADDWSLSWGTFDGPFKTPIVYPAHQTGTEQMTVRMWLTMGDSNNNYIYNPFQRRFEWSAASLVGTPFSFQTSSNLLNWVTLFTVTNNGAVNTYFVNNPASSARFYRLVPQ